MSSAPESLETPASDGTEIGGSIFVFGEESGEGFGEEFGERFGEKFSELDESESYPESSSSEVHAGGGGFFSMTLGVVEVGVFWK